MQSASPLSCQDVSGMDFAAYGRPWCVLCFASGLHERLMTVALTNMSDLGRPCILYHWKLARSRVKVRYNLIVGYL